MYWAAGIVVVILVVVGLITYNTAATNQDATAKAQALTAKFEAAGLPVPNEDVIVRTFGTDGGAVCANPASALGKATMFALITNGAAFVGLRPVIIDGRILQGEALILETYCPEHVDAFKEKVKDLKTAELLATG
jgi:hypothetical protein